VVNLVQQPYTDLEEGNWYPSYWKDECPIGHMKRITQCKNVVEIIVKRLPTVVSVNFYFSIFYLTFLFHFAFDFLNPQYLLLTLFFPIQKLSINTGFKGGHFANTLLKVQMIKTSFSKRFFQ
jgi:hypothetical protein